MKGQDAKDLLCCVQGVLQLVPGFDDLRTEGVIIRAEDFAVVFQQPLLYAPEGSFLMIDFVSADVGIEHLAYRFRPACSDPQQVGQLLTAGGDRRAFGQSQTRVTTA